MRASWLACTCGVSPALRSARTHSMLNSRAANRSRADADGLIGGVVCGISCTVTEHTQASKQERGLREPHQLRRKPAYLPNALVKFCK